MAHPGEDATGNIIVLSAPRCTLLRATEELGLCKNYRNNSMEAFAYNDRDNFKDSGRVQNNLHMTNMYPNATGLALASDQKLAIMHCVLHFIQQPHLLPNEMLKW